MTLIRFRVLLVAMAFSASLFAQNYTDKVPEWKKLYAKQDVVAASHREVVDYAINTAAKAGEARVKATVTREIVLVPLKNYIRYEDGLFYYDELSIDNLKVTGPDGKEVKVEKTCGSYQEENIFHSDAKLCVIRFPLGEAGKPYKLTYQHTYRDVKFLTRFFFHEQYPSIRRSVEVNVPAWLEAEVREFNLGGFSVERSGGGEGGGKKLVYVSSDVPPLNREPKSPNLALSYPHLVLVHKAFTENGQRQALFEGVKDLYGWYSSVCSNIGNKPEELKARVTALTEGKKTDMEKVESIFYWVQDNIRYIAFENGIMGFRPDAAQNVLNNKYGDCKGKANLLKEMLKLAGFDARLTWIGTSDLPYDYSLPSLCVDNHMICTVILGGKRYFLDGTEEHIALNDYAQRIQGKQVLIEDGKNYIIDRIPQFPAERNKVSSIRKMTIQNDHLIGTASVQFNGESKIMVQSLWSSIRSDNKSDALTAYLKHDDENMSVSNIRNPDFTDRQKPLQVSYDFKAAHQVTKTGNELYVVMDWDKAFGSMEMPADRKNDYEFSQKYCLTDQVELAIPEGYKVDYLPAAFKKTTPDFAFEGSYAQVGKTVVYKRTIIVNKPILRKTDFPAWNAFVAEISKFYNDQVVFTK